MIKSILTLTILVISQISLAAAPQTGCTNDMVIEAKSIWDKSLQSYSAGALSIASTLMAEANFVQTEICAAKLSKVTACPQLLRATRELVAAEKKMIAAGAGPYSELLNAISLKNEAEIFCK